jgi:tetratricopeptide (TPR) repeat protein
VTGAYVKVGDVLMAQGKLEEALRAYRDSLAIRERLAAADRSNTEWQHNLAVSHGKLALAYERLGQIAQALIQVRKGRDLLAALVAMASGNVQWAKDLALFDAQIARLEAL